MSEGDTIVLIIDYMMKFEDFRIRKSSRDHFGKIGLVPHGRLLRNKKMDGSKAKKECFVVLEGYRIQYSKAESRNLDIT